MDGSEVTPEVTGSRVRFGEDDAREPKVKELPPYISAESRAELLEEEAKNKKWVEDFVLLLDDGPAARVQADGSDPGVDADAQSQGEVPAGDSGEEGDRPDGDGDGEPQWLEDAHMGERIAREHLRGEFLHAGGLGWLKFDGRRWKPVEETIVAEVVRTALIDFHRSEAQRAAEADRLQRISRMLSASRIKAITYITKLRLATDREFDAHPDLLNVRNGVVDLRDGKLRPHDPDLMLTKVALVDYVPGATHPDWQQALAALPPDAVDWLQFRLGQGITGHPVPDDRLVVLKGSGSNGKTTIIDGVREALGTDYAVALPDRVLLARSGDHPTELMTLRGARLCLMEEFPELGHLNVKRLKDVLGTGEISARYCGKDTMTWKPSHTLFVTTNYLPRVDESDDGTWRRLVLLDFPYRYRPAREAKLTGFDRVGDPNLRERLRRGGDGQHEAILAWLIAGAVQWYQNNWVMPADPSHVQEATQAWRKTSDLLMRYIDDRLVFDPGRYVVATDLFADFNEWLKDNGHRGWSDQSFSARLTQHTQVMDNQAEKRRGIRSSRPGVSRPPVGLVTGGPLPQTFTAWLGIRFQTYGDE